MRFNTRPAITASAMLDPSVNATFSGHRPRLGHAAAVNAYPGRTNTRTSPNRELTGAGTSDENAVPTAAHATTLAPTRSSERMNMILTSGGLGSCLRRPPSGERAESDDLAMRRARTRV